MFLIRFSRRVIDFCLTMGLWAYFLFGYLLLMFVLFIPFHLRLNTGDAVLQKLFHVHLRFFFVLVGLVSPGVRFDISEDVRRLRSSIIVCNHLSYLDPILLVSLFPRQTTIVKNTFFSVPIFGWFLRKAGYVPSSPTEMYGPAMINHLENIKRHLAAGGNLFVFPEGTRSRNGRLAPFNKGVFSIARYCNTGLKLVFIRNTDRLFRPGAFSFETRGKFTISMELIGSLTADDLKNSSIGASAAQARERFERIISGTKTGGDEDVDSIF
jgi:1-acyl-sn-glycerol-3-phosphate acyltransferase